MIYEFGSVAVLGTFHLIDVITILQYIYASMLTKTISISLRFIVAKQ
jgi:hypothetical protein